MTNEINNSSSFAQNKTKVSVITGFLGAGKTTLLNNILSNPNGKKYAVIVNEFGEIGIDNDLVIGSDEEVFELSNGCVCCNVRGDLIRVLGALMKRKNAFDAIIVETTGLANPAPVAQTFYADDDIARKTSLDAIITLVDAVHALGVLGEYDEAISQIAFADIIVLNKIDEVSEEWKQKTINAIRQINKGVKIIETNNSIVNHEEILGIDSFSIDKMNNLDAYFEKEHHHHDHDHDHDETCNHEHHHADHVHDENCNHDHDHDHHDHDHFNGIESIAFEVKERFSEEKFGNWLSTIVDIYGEQLMRYKGLINIETDDRAFIVNGVHMMIEANYSEKLKKGKNDPSRMVFIGKDLPKEALESGFKSCVSC